MEWFNGHDYELARLVLQRGIAAAYVIAFLSTAAQFPALLGEHGLLPAPRLLATGGARGPSLFRWRYSDRLIRGVAVLGAAVSATLLLGLPQAGPPWLPLLAFLTVWLLYLSVVNIGQTFYAFGWESLLLEAGFVAALLGSDRVPPPMPVIVFTWWLVFRLEFGAGMIKMRGGREWRDLTALYFHHETQPMPNPVSRFAHLLPRPVHRVEVLGNHAAQLVVPWLLFAPAPVGSIAAGAIITTQLWLVVTGNFAWLNWITIVLAFSAVTDSAVHAVLPPAPLHWGAGEQSPLWWLVLVSAVTLGLVVLSHRPLMNLLSRRQLMNASFNDWHLVNAYGAFGTVTRERYEVIVEGSDAEDPAEDADWREYQFKGKPGDVTRMPRQFAPYHLRLDWLMWFLPFRYSPERWFIVLLMRLLAADAPTLRLLRVDPFAGRPPRWVRARMYLYRFSTRREKRATGEWWVREPVREFVPAVSLPPPAETP